MLKEKICEKNILYDRGRNYKTGNMIIFLIFGLILIRIKRDLRKLLNLLDDIEHNLHSEMLLELVSLVTQTILI